MTLLMLAAPSALAALSSPALLPVTRTIGPAAGDQENPVLVAGDGEYLLVWEDSARGAGWTLGTPVHREPRPLRDSTGRRRRAARLGPLPRRERAVAGDVPRAAYSDGQWLVAYDADAATAFYYSQGVYSKRIDAATGEVLDVDPILLVNDDSQDEWLHDVAGDGTGFAVLWQAADGAVYVLDGATVDAAGTSSGPVRLYTPTYNLYAPWNARIAWNTDRYLVGWDAWGAGAAPRTSRRCSSTGRSIR
jgi:hypothetical protein